MPVHKTPTLLALVLREHRSRYGLTQKQLATDLHVDAQTLRRWESCALLRDRHELRRIAVRLALDPERLGVAHAVSLPFTCDELDAYVTAIWQLVYEARLLEACNMVQRLVQDLTLQIANENDPRLSILAQLHHVAGFVTSINTRSSIVTGPLAHYEEMERLARLLADDTLLTLALTYQGDMHCRGGKVSDGIHCLEAARETTPNADVASKGHTAQLLARAYLKGGRFTDFEGEIAEAERLATLVELGTDSTRGQYSLGTVYEEYACGCPLLGKFDEAVEYVGRAEKHLETSPYWQILLQTTRALALVQNGDFQNGIPLALDAIERCQKHGMLRLLERMYALRRHLDWMGLRIRQVSV